MLGGTGSTLSPADGFLDACDEGWYVFTSGGTLFSSAFGFLLFGTRKFLTDPT